MLGAQEAEGVCRGCVLAAHLAHLEKRGGNVQHNHSLPFSLFSFAFLPITCLGGEGAKSVLADGGGDHRLDVSVPHPALQVFFLKHLKIAAAAEIDKRTYMVAADEVGGGSQDCLLIAVHAQ